MCSCPTGPNFVQDPNDPNSCLLNPCSRVPNANVCTPNFQEDKCECERNEIIQPPPGADPEDGFYGEWGEWSVCPRNCRDSENDLPIRQTRVRLCYGASTIQGLDCFAKGPAMEERSCGDMMCPEPPRWNNWGPWESCSSACVEEGKGNQLRRRYCLEGRNTEERCGSSQPSGPSTETRECLPRQVSCPSTVTFGEWGQWSSCDMSCHPQDGSAASTQTRTRQCRGSQATCKELDESITKQFRLCENIPLCHGNPCHIGWFRETGNGRLFWGCSDTDESGTQWCPQPGSVDEDSVAQSVHFCSDQDIKAVNKERIRQRRSVSNDDICNEMTLCKNNPDKLGKEY